MKDGVRGDLLGANKISYARRYPGLRTLGNIRCKLGEGPAWDSDSQLLYWVDIHRHTVFAASENKRKVRSWSVDSQPSAVIPTCSGDLLISAGQKLLRLKPDTGDLQSVTDLVGEPENNRCNDAKCDPFGNLWIGTMDSNEKEKVGRLWRFRANGETKVILENIGIANTLAWDITRDRFYFADSMTGHIYAFKYDTTSFEIHGRKIFFDNRSAPGVPDGSAIDEEGYLWNARWDGGCVVRVSPLGEVDRVIELPAKRPTSCAFGGVDLKTLYVTSAANSLPYSDESEAYGGAVFCLDVDVKGAAVPPYAGLSFAAQECRIGN